MTILDKILFAQDFADTSKNLESVAASLANAFNSTIVPIHVLPDDIVNPKVKGLVDDAAQSKLQATSKALEEKNVKVESPIIKYGTAHDEIIMAASTVNANMILVGSGEKTDGERFELGTTTERIIQRSLKPVLVIKENDAFNIKTILCPVDFSKPSERALKNALIFARRFNAHLIILSISENTSSSWFSSKQELEKENEDRLKLHIKEFDAFLEKFNLEGVNWSKEERSGAPSQEILNTITVKNVDLLIMGTSGRSGLNRLVLGSVTEKVIREVPCSFLTLKSQDAISLELKTNIKDFEALYQAGEQLEKDGFYEEAIEQYKASLGINTMHVPTYNAIAKLLKKLGQPEKAALYLKNAEEIKQRIWYSKIEDEVRKLRSN